MFCIIFLLGAKNAFAAAQVYYSVGQNTSDHKSGSPTMTIEGGVATFSVAQSATNLGVGDKITYNTSSYAYISGKISTMQWKVVTNLGATPNNVENATVDSIAHAFSSLYSAEDQADDASYLNSTDLTALDVQLNFPCYYDGGNDTTGVTVDGWTTDSDNFIKIYTPFNTSTEVNQSQRHTGKSTGANYKYYRNSYGISINEDYVWIDGLEIETYSTENPPLYIQDGAGEIRISNCLGKSTGDLGFIYINAGSHTYKIWNNTFSGYSGIFGLGTKTAYVYNNTLYHVGATPCNRPGIYGGANTYAKNNVIQGFGGLGGYYDYTGSFNAASVNNISLDTSSPNAGSTDCGGHSCRSQTVTFVDAGGGDFHLSSSDTAAKNSGTDRSTDANLPFANDIDNNNRATGSAWDVGADEIAAIPVYYSVGQSSSDLKTGTPTLTIAAGVGTFSTGQIGNIGVGDRVTYNTSSIAYIAAKVSTDMTQWRLVTATGAAPGDVTGATVDSITHEYTSLSAAEAGAVDSNHLNTTDLAAGNYQLNIPCYYDTGADTTAVTVNGITTSVGNYIKIYTPNNTLTEANFSQRHEGKWDASRYNLTWTTVDTGITINVNNVRIDGLQIYSNGDSNSAHGIYFAQQEEIRISNNIIRNNASYSRTKFGIYSENGGSTNQVYNNIVYDFILSSSRGIYVGSSFSVFIYVHNNTVYNCNVGISSGWNDRIVAKNNLIIKTTTPATGTFAAGTDYNATDISSLGYTVTGSGNTHDKLSRSIRFLDEANDDFHLHPLDTAAVNAGTDLSADANLPLITDIDNQARPTQALWDIGADEATTGIYRSVAVGATSALATGSNNGLAISGSTAVFDVPLADTIGVGDAIQYDADQNGSVDSLAFIHERLSSTRYVIKKASGYTPTAITGTIADTDWSIFRAYTTLALAEAGTENTGISDTVENFDRWSNGRDIATVNEQWNVTAYAGSGADTTMLSVNDWTTAPLNYLKFYAPISAGEAGSRQRHGGKFDTGKHYLQVSNSDGVRLYDEYVRIEGLQVQRTSTNADYQTCISIGNVGKNNDIQIGNNILDQAGNGTYREPGIVISDSEANSRIYNNVIYGTGSLADSNNSAVTYFSTAKSYLYNNTIIGGWRNVSIAGGTIVLKNNILNDSAYAVIAGSPDSSSDYNSTDRDSATGGANDRLNRTYTFVDEANFDFHLASTDAGAKNLGTDLTADSNLPLATDIEGQARPSGSATDIGADERLNNVYYSVGQDALTDRKVAATLGISNGVMTFSSAQTGNIGVGDRVTYNVSSVAYISGKIDQSNWYVVDKLGDKPADIAAGTALVSITREYSSLANAESGATDANHLNSSDLGAVGVVLNFPCYYDTGADPNASTVIDGYTTLANNYIRIYTPQNTSTESNFIQRHNGTLASGFRMASGSSSSVIAVRDKYVRVDGINIQTTNASGAGYGVAFESIETSGTGLQLTNSLISSGTSTGTHYGFYTNNGNITNLDIANNIFHSTSNTSNMGLYIGNVSSGAPVNVYANTIYNYSYNVYATGNPSVTLKNNIAVNRRVADFYKETGSFATSSSNNISSDASAPGSGSLTSQSVASMAFISTAANTFDLHVGPASVARDAGANLAYDGSMPVTSDIDGNLRSGYANATDIGADEGAMAIYRSISPNDSSNLNTSSRTVTISGTTATFSDVMPDNVGVGDALQYQLGGVYYLAFITARNSSTVYTVKDRIGNSPMAAPALTNVGVYRAYTNLPNAEAGSESVGINAAARNFDSWANGKNLAAANEQWSIACYAYGTTADTLSATLTITDWTTAATNYLRIYTPTSSVEVGVSQRHDGKWNANKYYISRTMAGNYSYALNVSEEYVRLDGLQVMQINSAYSDNRTISIGTATAESDVRISNNIVRGDISGSAGTAKGISYYATPATAKIWNNLVYGFNVGASAGFHVQPLGGAIPYFYNNTSYGNNYGFFYYLNGGNAILKNNLASGNTTADYYNNSGPAMTGAVSNISSDASSPNSGGTDCGGHSCRSQTVAFFNAAGSDFHLSQADAAARNSGTDLSADTNWPFAADFDSQERPGPANASWDIGADEAGVSVYRSVGTTATNLNTNNRTVTIAGTTATFSNVMPKDVGVGDVLQYQIAGTYYLAFISGRTSTTVFTVQSSSGGTPQAASAGQSVGVYRSYNALANFQAQNENDTLDDTVENFDTTLDIYSLNYQVNVACYKDGADQGATNLTGWTVSPVNYIRIFTPYQPSEVGESQRHNGVTYSSGYYMEDVVPGWHRMIDLNISYARVEGIAFYLPVQGSNGVVIGGDVTNVHDNIVDSCLFYDDDQSFATAGFSAVARSYWRVSNSIARGLDRGFYTGGYATDSYIYNSVAVGCDDGFSDGTDLGDDPVLINNVAYNNTADYPTVAYWSAASRNNASDSANAADIPGSNAVTGLTSADFVNVSTGDMHLSAASRLKNAGYSLSSVFTKDMDGATRNIDSRGWDIGYDELATNIYYSVGQSAADLKSDAPTVTISSGTATFSVAQTGNIGVGDRLTYNTNSIAYIAAKTSTSVWTVQTATGAAPADVTDATVNSITREFTSLSTAEANAENSSHLNTTDLWVNNYTLNFPCYYDSGADTTYVSIYGWNTAAANYIKLYTPNNTSMESNQNQRHSGVWDETKYRLEVSTNTMNVNIYTSFTTVEGLQIKATRTQSYNDAIYIQPDYLFGGATTNISHNIVRGNLSGGIIGTYGIRAGWHANPATRYANIWNNVVYDFENDTETLAGILIHSSWTQTRVYNNTVYNCDFGYGVTSTTILKNNISYGNTVNYSVNGSVEGTSTNNLSGPTQSDAPGLSPRNAQAVEFVAEAKRDFHLKQTDAGAREVGVNLSTDANMPFANDIDGGARPTQSNWDIGADEGATLIYRSVAAEADGDLPALATGGANAMTISGSTASFASALPDNVGVGDAIQYDDDGDSDIDANDSIVFIAARTDSQRYTVKTASGAAPTAVAGDTDWSLLRAYTSLANAEDGTENTAIDSDLRDFDSWSGGKDILLSNEQWNIALYANGTTADTSNVTINGWTTASNNYVRIFTPSVTAEVGRSQRHSGEWDESKYRLDTFVNGGAPSINILENFIRIDGLQIKGTNTSGWCGPAINFSNSISSDSDIRISNNILQANYSGAQDGFAGAALRDDGWGALSTKRIWNNVVYDTVKTEHSSGITFYGGTAYLYNNTVSNVSSGIDVNGGTIISKNNLSYNNTNDFVGTFSSLSTNNLSKDATAPDYGTYYRNATVQFSNEADQNFHLSVEDTEAKNKGINLSSDIFLPITTDIDGSQRTGEWSIGADDGPFAEVQGEEKADPDLGISSGLVLYQSFDGNALDWAQTSAEARDQSGSNNHGDVVGAIASVGKRGQGMDFDAVDDYVNNGSAASLDNLPALAISIWAKPSGWGENSAGYLVSKSNIGTAGWRFSLLSSMTSPQFSVDYDGANDLVVRPSAGSVTFNEWAHWVVTWDGTANASGVHIYKNGTEVAYQTQTNGEGNHVSDASQNLLIGNSTIASPDRTFDGTLDEVRVYNRVISTEEIGQLYRGGEHKANASQNDKIKNGLVGLWSFDGADVSGSTAYDRSGQGNNGTISGATPAIGKKGQGMSFDGSSGSLMVGNDASTYLNFGSGNVSFWYRSQGPGSSNSPQLFSFDASGDSLLVNFYENTSLAIQHQGDWNGYESLLVSVPDIRTDENWHFVSVNWDVDGIDGGSNTLSISFDGVTTAEAHTLFEPTSFSGNVYFGRSSYGGAYFNGIIDEMRLYDRTLTTQELSDLYRLGQSTISQ